jgi:tRNA A-37 threonylcarbamoyl transferase component Bud32
MAEERIDEVIAEFLEAEAAGQTPDRAALLARHADLADELRSFFADHDRMRKLAEPLQAPVAGEAPTLGLETPLSPGTTARHFGDYEILEEIARGGMGVVYKARQLSLNRIVALKMILAGEFASDADVQRFRTEAEAAANLDHPNIVPIYEVGEHEGQHYFSMKFIEGGSLAQWIADCRLKISDFGKARQAECAQLIATVARAVHHAHQHGVLHRDLKPANILLQQTATSEQSSITNLQSAIPHVTDFGLAKRVERDSKLTQSGAIVGTPSYMAPEQARGEKGLSTAVDVYSLGAILYELLTGRPPFRAETPLETVLQLLEEEPERPRSLNTKINRDLETICLKCLEKDPARRYNSSDALAGDFERWLAGDPILARPAGRLVRTAMWCRRRPAVTGLLVALVALFLVALPLVSWQWYRAEDALERVVNERDTVQRERSKTAQQLYLNQIALADRDIAGGNSMHALEVLNQCAPEHRRWEWDYLQHLCQSTPHNKLSPSMGKQVSGYREIAYSPDGNSLVALAELRDNRLALICWQGTSLKETWTILLDDEHSDKSVWSSDPVRQLVWSPDSARLVLAGSTTLHMWDVKTRNETKTFSFTGLKPDIFAPIYSAVFSPDGKMLAALSSNHNCDVSELRVWDGDNGQELFVQKGKDVFGIRSGRIHPR